MRDRHGMTVAAYPRPPSSTGRLPGLPITPALRGLDLATQPRHQENGHGDRRNGDDTGKPGVATATQVLSSEQTGTNDPYNAECLGTAPPAPQQPATTKRGQDDEREHRPGDHQGRWWHRQRGARSSSPVDTAGASPTTAKASRKSPGDGQHGSGGLVPSPVGGHRVTSSRDPARGFSCAGSIDWGTADRQRRTAPGRPQTPPIGQGP